MPKDVSAFTIRIPGKLTDQIMMRARLHRRTRNKEIEHLLEYAIDHMVEGDLRLMRAQTDDSPRE